MIIVTKELLNRIRTNRGGYTSIQKKVLGCSPAKKGWTKEVLGKKIEHWRILFYEKNKKYPKDFVMPKFKTGWDWKRIRAKDVTYKDTWKNRNTFLDGSYGEFLNSEHWNRVKDKTKKRLHYYGQCRFCGSKKNIELHHLTYKFINTQFELQYIKPLCRTHHQEVHDYAKLNNISVIIATEKLMQKYKSETLHQDLP